MQRDIRYKKCEVCGNQNLLSDYDYINEMVNEYCDVCSYYNIKVLSNKVEGGNYPVNWEAKYEEASGISGYVIKIFEEFRDSYYLSVMDKEGLKEGLNWLKNDIMVYKFSITYKNNNGFYQTDIFNKAKSYKNFKVIFAFKDSDELIEDEILAKNNIEAIKLTFIREFLSDESSINYIKDMNGDEKELIKELEKLGLIVKSVQ